MNHVSSSTTWPVRFTVTVYHDILRIIDAIRNIANMFTEDLLSVLDMMVCGRSTKKVRAKNQEFSFLKM